MVLISFAVYLNALSDGFVYDDASQIVGNPWLRDISYIPTIFSKSVWGFRSELTKTNYYRPLMHVIYLFNYQLFGLKAWGFHLVNVLLHCGVSVLVFMIMRRLLPEHRDPASPAYLSSPLIAAVIFAVHPIHTEAVTWLAGLPDVAFTFFYLLSFYFHIRSRAAFSGSHWISVACFAVASLFKEPALTLPAVLVAYDYACLEKRASLPDFVKKYAPYLVVMAGYFALRIHALGEFAPQARRNALSAYQYAINVFPLFALYLEKLLIPLNQKAFYVFHPVSSLLGWQGVLSLIATAAFAASFFVAFKRSRLAFLSLVFIVVPLLPALYIPALGVNAFTERYLYLPSAGYVFLLAILLSSVRKKLPQAGRGVTIALIVMAGLYSFGTIRRNIVWKDNLNL